MNNENEKLEKVLNQALEFYEKGKSIPEILNLFPEYQDELKEIFQAIEVLLKEKERIVPPKELLVKIISQSPVSSLVTKREFSRYLYRGEKEPEFSGIKGRPSIWQLLEKISLLTMNKVYLGIGILALVLIIVGGIYWQSQKVVVSPVEKELTAEEESLTQDINELEELSQDTNLDTLEQDLSEITGEETASIENLESELALELDSFSDDFSELENFEGDTSLDNLDSGLSNIIE